MSLLVRRLVDAVMGLAKYIAVVLAAAGTLIIVLGAVVIPYASGDELTPIGHMLVSSEVHIIPGLVYMKPITISVLLIVLGHLFGLEYIDVNVRLRRSSLHALTIISLFAMFVSSYEVMYNFMLWGSLISSLSRNGAVEHNIDMLVNPFPNPDMAWNLVFATKVFTTILFMSVVTLVYVVKWRMRGEGC